MLFLTFLLHATASEPVRLDAGSLVSPLMPGFSRLHLEGSEDPRVRWHVMPDKAVTSAFPEPLSTDHLRGGALQLDLEPGTWHVWVMQGHVREDPRLWAGRDAWGLRADGRDVLRHEMPDSWESFLASDVFAKNPRPVFRDEETAWHRQLAPRHGWEHAEVVVGEEGLRLAAFGLPLQALVLAPADQRAEVEIELAITEGHRAASWQRHYAPEATNWERPPASPGPLTVTPLRYATGRPLQALVGEPLHLDLRIDGGDAPGTWRIRASRALEVEAAELSWLDAEGHLDRPLVPRPIIAWPGTGWTGGQNVPPVVRVTVTPTTPGTHQAQVIFRRGSEVVRHKLVVEAVDVQLDPWIPAGLYLQVPPEAWLREGDPLDLVLQQLDLLASHGLTAASLRYVFWKDGYPSQSPVDTSLFEEVAKAWSVRGGRALVWADPKVALRPHLRTDVLPVIPPQLDVPLRDMLLATVRGPLPIYVHAYEEEAYKRADVVPRARQLAEELRALVPVPIRLLAATPTPVDWPVADAFDVVTVTHPLPVPGTHDAPTPRQPDGMWAYNLSPGRAGPLEAWAGHASGLLQWHANPLADDPFHAVRRPTRWFHTVLNPDGRYLATTWLDDMAEGVFLARMLTTLERLHADMANHASCDAVTAELQGFLTATRRAVADAHPADIFDGEPFPADALNALQQQARSLLIAHARRPASCQQPRFSPKAKPQ
jgi:hypothetical protein